MQDDRMASPEYRKNVIKRLERFSALPKDEQVHRHTRASEINSHISRLNRWFVGLPAVTFIALASQFFLDGEALLVAIFVSWALLWCSAVLYYCVAI